MSGEQFQQWSQGSPLLSLDRFHLKQTPVLNFNCRESLGFPSYILHKKTFFSAWFAFSSVASLNFSLPKWLALHLFKCLHHFSFRCQSGLLSMTKKRFASLFFFVALVGFFGTSGGQLDFGWRALGPDWEFSGIPPAWVLLGGPSFFWDFGNTLNFGGPSFLGRP